MLEVTNLDFAFPDKTAARQCLVKVTDLFRNWNYAATDSDEYRQGLAEIDRFIATKGQES